MLETMVNEFNNVFYRGRENFSFPVDVLENEEGYKVIAELPGVGKDDVKIDYEDGILKIRAIRKKENNKYLINERKSYEGERIIDFGDINEDNISAKLENGLLSVVIKKKKEIKEKKTIIIE